MGGARKQRAKKICAGILPASRFKPAMARLSSLLDEEEMDFDPEFSAREGESESSEDDVTFFSVSFSKSQPSHSHSPLTSKHQSSSRLNPPSHLGQSSPASFSPIVSPVKQRDERTAEIMRQKNDVESCRRLLLSAEGKIERIEELQALEGKTTDLMNQGGIMGMAERLKRASVVEQDVEVANSPPSSPNVVPVVMKEGDNSSEPDIAVTPPGMPLFVNAPQLMENLAPPTLIHEGSLPPLQAALFQSNPTALHEAVVGEWLSLLYCSKPCPVEIMDWLLEVACLSPDSTLRESAFQSFRSLLPRVLQSQQRQQHPLTHQRILSVLVKLGADYEKLNSFTCFAEGLSGISQPVYPDATVTILCDCIHKITCLMVQGCTITQNLYSLNDVQELVKLLLMVSLDPVVCSHGLNFEISTCLNSLLVSLSEDDQRPLRHKLAASAPLLFSHHHDQLHVVECFSYCFPDLRPIQRLLLRSFLQAAVSSGAQEQPGADEVMDECPYPQSSHEPPSDTAVTDSELAINVMVYYSHLPLEEVNYYQLHSVGTMLSIFLLSPEMTWSDAQSKQKFLGLLSHLCSVRIKDSISAPVRGPVKDLLIRLRMELQSQNESGNLKQRDLFGHFID